MPPHASWPNKFEPWRAIVAENGHRPNTRNPYRIHLFFGSNSTAFNALQKLADDLDGIRKQVMQAINGDSRQIRDDVFFSSSDRIRCARATFGTHPCAAGVPLCTAQAAMRHSKPELTANIYTDPKLLDVAGAIDALPALSVDAEAATAMTSQA